MNVKTLAMGIVAILLFSVNLYFIPNQINTMIDEGIADAQVMTADTWEDESWLNSTGQRSYYAWNITNLEAYQSGVAESLEFEKVGPVIYDITTHRTVLHHDEVNGILTYEEYNSFEWADGLAGDTQLTNMNILWDPQRIGATSLAVDIGAQFTKGYFTRNMLEFDLLHRAPAQIVAEQVKADAMVQQNAFGTGSLHERAFFNNAYTEWNNTFEVQAMYNLTLEENNVTTQYTWEPFEHGDFEHDLLYGTDPGDATVCIGITCELGVLMFVGDGTPDENASDLTMSSNSTVRAIKNGYAAFQEDGNLDKMTTWVRDTIIYGLVEPLWLETTPVASLDELTHDQLNDRLEQMTGVRIDHEPTLDHLLYGVVDGTHVGLLSCDSMGIMCGVTHFLQGASEDPFGTMNEYTVNNSHRFGYSELVGIAQNWAGGWFLGDSSYEWILTGGSGRLNADAWLDVAFGSTDPVTGGYIPLGLNQAGVWGLMYGDPVDISAEVSHNILFGETHGLTSSFGVDFLYGEMAGVSVPMDENMTPMAGGVQHVWNDTFVAELYGIDENAAKSLRWLVREKVFNEFIGDLLGEFFGAEPYLTQSVNEWLFGWRDPLVATLAGDENDPELGWVSLEKNATYYGSGGVSTESETVISIYTGAKAGNMAGERLAQDGDVHLPWRTPARNESAYGLLPPVIQAGVAGGMFDADSPVRLNLGGYAVATSTVTGPGSVGAVETVQHNLVVDPTQNPIQAKLIGAESVLDVFPGALPIYFGAEVVVQVEPNLDKAVGGEANSYFYLDVRGVGHSNPSMANLTPVFQIQSSGAPNAEQMEQLVGLQRSVGMLESSTDFDTTGDEFYLDQVMFALYLVADVLILLALKSVFLPAGIEEETEDEVDAAFDDDEGVDQTAEVEAEEAEDEGEAASEDQD